MPRLLDGPFELPRGGKQLVQVRLQPPDLLGRQTERPRPVNGRAKPRGVDRLPLLNGQAHLAKVVECDRQLGVHLANDAADLQSHVFDNNKPARAVITTATHQGLDLQ